MANDAKANTNPLLQVHVSSEKGLHRHTTLIINKEKTGRHRRKLSVYGRSGGIARCRWFQVYSWCHHANNFWTKGLSASWYWLFTVNVLVFYCFLGGARKDTKSFWLRILRINGLNVWDHFQESRNAAADMRAYCT